MRTNATSPKKIWSTSFILRRNKPAECELPSKPCSASRASLSPVFQQSGKCFGFVLPLAVEQVSREHWRQPVNNTIFIAADNLKHIPYGNKVQCSPRYQLIALWPRKA